jgi:hypothetical protein
MPLFRPLHSGKRGWLNTLPLNLLGFSIMLFSGCPKSYFLFTLLALIVLTSRLSRALEVQIPAIDAAVAAGVKRFLPSEFGYDNSNAKTAAMTADLPIFGNKITVKKHLEAQAASHPDFTYTLVETGSFIDWGLEKSFIFDLQSGKPRIFDGGDVPFSVTTLETAAQGVLGVLEHPDETKNRAVHVQARTITQNKILALAKKVAPEKTKSWEPFTASIAAVKTAADAALAKGDSSLSVLFEYLYVTFIAEGYGGEYKTLDNDLLGVAGDMTDADVEDILAPLLK